MFDEVEIQTDPPRKGNPRREAVIAAIFCVLGAMGLRAAIDTGIYTPLPNTQAHPLNSSDFAPLPPNAQAHPLYISHFVPIEPDPMEPGEIEYRRDEDWLVCDIDTTVQLFLAIRLLNGVLDTCNQIWGSRIRLEGWPCEGDAFVHFLMAAGNLGIAAERCTSGGGLLKELELVGPRPQIR